MDFTSAFGVAEYYGIAPEDPLLAFPGFCSISPAFSAPAGPQNTVPPPASTPQNVHGTHCATEIAALAYLGHVFAQREVVVVHAENPSKPLPFVFRDDALQKHALFCAAKCTVLGDNGRDNTLLCVPSARDQNGDGGVLCGDGKRQKTETNSQLCQRPSATRWDVVGVFHVNSGDHKTGDILAVDSTVVNVLRLILEAVKDMPDDVKTFYTVSVDALQQPPTSTTGTACDALRTDAEKRLADVVSSAEATWKDLLDGAGEQQLPWTVFVDRFCANPCNVLGTTRAAITSLRRLLCVQRTQNSAVLSTTPAHSGMPQDVRPESTDVVTEDSWKRFVCMFWVGLRSSSRVLYNWTEAYSLLSQQWFSSTLDKAAVQGALARPNRSACEYLIRISDTLWRYGVFVLSRSYPGHGVVHTWIARHRPGETWCLALTRAGVVRYEDVAKAGFSFASTGGSVRVSDHFFYAVPFVDCRSPTRIVWPTLNGLVADVAEHYRAQKHPYPLAPSRGTTVYQD